MKKRFVNFEEVVKNYTKCFKLTVGEYYSENLKEIRSILRLYYVASEQLKLMENFINLKKYIYSCTFPVKILSPTKISFFKFPIMLMKFYDFLENMSYILDITDLDFSVSWKTPSSYNP